MQETHSPDIPLQTESADVVEATLEGGPASLPPSQRRLRIAPSTEVVKVPHLGGYEHFARAECAGQTLVFRWSARTRVAE